MRVFKNFVIFMDHFMIRSVNDGGGMNHPYSSLLLTVRSMLEATLVIYNSVLLYVFDWTNPFRNRSMNSRKWHHLYIVPLIFLHRMDPFRIRSVNGRRRHQLYFLSFLWIPSEFANSMIGDDVFYTPVFFSGIDSTSPSRIRSVNGRH